MQIIPYGYSNQGSSLGWICAKDFVQLTKEGLYHKLYSTLISVLSETCQRTKDVRRTIAKSKECNSLECVTLLRKLIVNSSGWASPSPLGM